MVPQLKTILGLILFAACASAASVGLNYSVDENCNGTLVGVGALPCGLIADPGPGGIPSALTYDLLNPQGLVAGDVILLDGDGNMSDLVRFNDTAIGPGGGTGTLVFYSNPYLPDPSTPILDDLADSLNPPSSLYGNQKMITETNGTAVYVPVAGEPGFQAGATGPVTYTILSDELAPDPAPEPGSLLLVFAGAGALIYRRYSER